MPSMTDCNRAWLGAYGRYLAQAERATGVSTAIELVFKLMGRVKIIFHHKLRARLPVFNTRQVAARSKVV